MNGLVAVVTGASSGIGAAVASRLADRGFAVGLTARRADLLESVARGIRERGHRVAVAPADAADPAALRAAIAALAGELGPVDLLVANAGMAERNPADDFSAARFEQLVRVNLLAPAVAIEAVLPGMLERGRGQIVGVSSLAGYRAFKSGQAGYSASKAALSTLLEGLRLELRDRGVAVSVVHPGYVHTPMTAGNRGGMPFVMGVDRAADIIVRGIERQRPRIDFPLPAALGMGLLRILPGPIHEALVRRLDRPAGRPTA